MKSLLGLTFVTLVASQGLNSCLYRIGGIELDLRSFQGFTFRYEGNDGVYFYAPCTNDLQCERGGVTRAAMMDYYRDGINECVDTANYDPKIQPFYEFFISSFIFNYTSNDLCPDTNLPQTNRSSTIAWNCNEDASFPYISDVNHYNGCNDFVQIEWVGACAPPPPPNLECVFRDAGHVLNLSTIAGTTLKYTDSAGHQVLFSPCSNGFVCNTPYGPKPNMAEILDTNGECFKYFGIWSGDAAVYYDRTIFGQDYYEFFWMNGEECGDGGPPEIFNVRYYCANNTNTQITSFAQAGPPCNFRMEIDTPLACEKGKDGKPIFPTRTV